MKKTIQQLEHLALTTIKNDIYSKTIQTIKNLFDLFQISGQCEYHLEWDDRSEAAHAHESRLIRKINNVK